MLIALCGKSGVGKTVLAAKLSDYGYTKVVTDTTRPMREGEEHGVDYYFDDLDTWKEYEEEGEFLEKTSYTVANGETWHYGTTKGQLNDALGGDNKAVIILNPDGIRAFKGQNIPMVVFQITSDETVILSRLMARGDSRKEIKRRMRADDADFAAFDKYVDYMIENRKDTDLDDLAQSIINLAELGA